RELIATRPLPEPGVGSTMLKRAKQPVRASLSLLYKVLHGRAVATRSPGVSPTRRRAEAALAVLCAVLLLIVGGGAIWLRSMAPAREGPAMLPSTTAATPSDRYAGPVDESRRLARALVADDNLIGLSVAVAVDGEVAWAEAFGWIDADRVTPLTPA